MGAGLDALSASVAVFRLLVVGCGRVFSRYHLAAVRSQPGVTIVGAVEPDAQRLEWARQAVDSAACGPSMDEVIDGVEADGVLVTTPPASHGEIVRRCLGRGLPVLVEKPLTLDLSEAMGVVEAQRQAGQPLMVGFNRRFYGPYRELKQSLGSVSAVVRITYRLVAEQERWRPGAEESTTAHVLQDLGCHAFDLVRFLSGSPLSELRASQAGAGEVGVRCDISARTASGVEARCLVGHGPAYEEWLTVETTSGTHRVRIAGGSPWDRLGQTLALVGRRLARRPTTADASFADQLRAFVETCGGRPSTDAAGPLEGLAAVEGVGLAQDSLTAGGSWCSVPSPEQ